MRKKKLPPMSAMNGLQLAETDEMIKEEGLKLTELEGALIAKSIIFQKIYQLPKSRWTALKDRLINIPKLIEIKYTMLPEDTTIKQQSKLFKLQNIDSI